MSHVEASIRKAAILISALDDRTADRLLEQMGDEQSARVRNAILGLGDVPAWEQEQVLTEFFGRPADRANANDGVELEVSEASQKMSEQRTIASPQSPPNPVNASSEPRFAFLELVPAAELAARLEREHPQLISVVIGEFTPEKAADVLRCMAADLRHEVLDRLEAGGEVFSEALDEIERHLRATFTESVERERLKPLRRSRVAAIREHLQPFTPPPPEPVLPPESSPAIMEHAAEPSAMDAWGEYAEELPAFEFEELLALSAAEFFAVFDEADSRYVMLALAGASRRLFERYVARLSAARAEEYERHLEQLRPLHLRDVEFAQQQLAKIAARRLQAAKMATENSRRITMTA